MKSNYLNSNILVAMTLSFSFSHSLAHAEEIPEQGPKISLETEDNFEDLGRACDLENMQMEEISASIRPSNVKTQDQTKAQTKTLAKNQAKDAKGLPCQKLLDADNKFQIQMKQARCESLDTYVPTEKEIRSCQINLRKSAGLGKVQRYEEDIKNRDQCIVKLQANYCQKTTNINSFGD